MQHGETANAGVEYRHGKLCAHVVMVAEPAARFLASSAMRALVVTNMYPSPERPALGSFVRDQVQALQRIDDVELDVFAFAPGGYGAYTRASRELGRRFRGERFDIVHAHFGLSAWPARAVPTRGRVVTLHGTDLEHPRSRAITLAGLRTSDIVGVTSPALAQRIPRWACSPKHVQVLPCGVDLGRFERLDRRDARARLGLDPGGRYVLFSADPTRREKRFDRAQALLDGLDNAPTLLTLGNVEPADVPAWINAANAVLVTSERESFGLAALEALACDVPVLSTPVGVAPEALRGVAGALCAPFDEGIWRAALQAHLCAEDPRLVDGRAHAEPYSSDTCAQKVLAAWTELLDHRGW
jgi:teichuronic acid biosynthesis glycosyltransferase TuaC